MALANHSRAERTSISFGVCWNCSHRTRHAAEKDREGIPGAMQHSRNYDMSWTCCHAYQSQQYSVLHDILPPQSLFEDTHSIHYKGQIPVAAFHGSVLDKYCWIV